MRRILSVSGRAHAPMLFLWCALVSGCSAPSLVDEEIEAEVLSRTEFTDRIENFFEYDPLRSGETGEFLIHLTDLLDGSPVSDARVQLSVRMPGSESEVAGTMALVGRVTGIYVARLEAPDPGIYDIEFRVQNESIDESMILHGFEVE